MRRIILCPLAILILGLAQPSQAGQNSEAEVSSAPVQSAEVVTLIAKVKAAYGGRKLENLKSFRLRTNRELAWPGQGQTADYVEFSSDRFEFIFDLKAEKGSLERWSYQNGNAYSGREVTTNEGIAIIDYFTNTYFIEEDETYSSKFGWIMRASDMLLAYSLVINQIEVSALEPQMYQGVTYDRISFRTDADAPLSTLYIHPDTGLIERLHMERPYGTWSTLFSHHKSDSGIAYASQNMNYRNDALVRYAMDVDIDVNKVKSADFLVKPDLTLQTERFDTSEMTVDRIGEHTSHVGQDYSYSAFFDAGDYIVATNPSAGFTDRYEAFANEQLQTKPLRYVLMTHHHSDHLDGVSEAIALGATVVGTPMTIKTLKAEDMVQDGEFLSLDSNRSFGPVATYVVGTSHAVEYMIIFVDEDKVLYQDDHYNPTALNGVSRVNQSDLVLKSRIEALGLDVDTILSGHGRKAERWTDFERAAAQVILGDICPKGRKICR